MADLASARAAAVALIWRECIPLDSQVTIVLAFDGEKEIAYDCGINLVRFGSCAFGFGICLRPSNAQTRGVDVIGERHRGRVMRQLCKTK